MRESSYHRGERRAAELGQLCEGSLDREEHHTVHIKVNGIHLSEKGSRRQEGCADTDDIDTYAPQKSQDTRLDSAPNGGGKCVGKCVEKCFT